MIIIPIKTAIRGIYLIFRPTEVEVEVLNNYMINVRCINRIKSIWIYGHLQMTIPSLVLVICSYMFTASIQANIHLHVLLHVKHAYSINYMCMPAWLHNIAVHHVALHYITLHWIKYIHIHIDIYVYINILNISTKGVAPRSTELIHWRDAVRRPCISRVSWCRWCRGTHCFVPSFSGENCSFKPENSSF